MGIRFACNLCEHSLNIKRELAGKVGVCPHCGGRIRIPSEDAQQSRAVANESTSNGSVAQSQQKHSTSHSEVSTGSNQASITAAALEGSATLDTFESDGHSRQSPLDEPGAQWYVRPPAGGQYGPATGEVLRTWITENRVTGSTLIWRDGWPQWRSARETLPELAESSKGLSPSNTIATTSDPLNDPLTIPSHAVAQPLPGSLTGSAAIGQQRSTRSQRRMLVVIGLAVLSVILIVTLVVLAMQS